MKKWVAILFATLLVVGCKDSEQSLFDSLDKRHHIKQYGCDGKLINEWTSTGRVHKQVNSDSWYFEDAATNKLVEVTGTIVITVD